MRQRYPGLDYVILLLKSGVSDQSAAEVQERLAALGLTSEKARSGARLMVIVTDETATVAAHHFSRLDHVEKVINVSPRCPLTLDATTEPGFSIGATRFGGGEPLVIAGPCSVEGRAQMLEVAQAVKKAGAKALRGGAFKPRTNPYDFCGLGKEALEYLAEARESTGLPVISEVMSAEQIEQAIDYIDVLQIGARNMYNYELLKEAGKTQKPILLKRAMSATVDELLQAAEYILLEGNSKVILCERGIRTFETRTRNTLDLNAVAVLKTMTQLPVFVDPSHACGRSALVQPLARAAIACGADGLIIETHLQPQKSLSDHEQAITPSTLADIVNDMKTLARLFAPAKTFSACSPVTKSENRRFDPPVSTALPI
ncbi:MAG TPA: 3-deoxy-7-phosphoheptulonate synthase [Planktothrix sp.]|jgi:3-deoxy-7-phosphoheptulonate synthase